MVCGVKGLISTNELMSQAYFTECHFMKGIIQKRYSEINYTRLIVWTLEWIAKNMALLDIGFL